MTTPNFIDFPSSVTAATLSGSNGIDVSVVAGTPNNKIVVSLDEPITVINNNVGIGMTPGTQRLSINGNVSADGIVFGSTGGSITSKTLEDYEQGTWSPQLFSAIDPNTYLSLEESYGKYIKIGRKIFIQVWITVSDPIDIDGNEYVCLTLPWVSDSGDPEGSLVTSYCGNLNTPNLPTGKVNAGLAYANLYKYSAGTTSAMIFSDFNPYAFIVLNGNYQTSI